MVILSESRGGGTCQSIPRRNLGLCAARSLDFPGDDSSSKPNSPFWNLNFSSAQKLPRFDDRDTGLGRASEIDEHLMGFECPWDYSFRWLNMVRKPNRSSYTRSSLL